MTIFYEQFPLQTKIFFLSFLSIFKTCLDSMITHARLFFGALNKYFFPNKTISES